MALHDLMAGVVTVCVALEARLKAVGRGGGAAWWTWGVRQVEAAEVGRVERQGAVQSTRDLILLPSQCRSWNSIGPDGAAALAGHLEGLTNLQSLSLRY